MLYNMDTVHHCDEEVASSDWDYHEIIWQDLRRGEEDGVLQKIEENDTASVPLEKTELHPLF